MATVIMWASYTILVQSVIMWGSYPLSCLTVTDRPTTALLLLIDLYPSPHRGYHWNILKQCWIMTSVKKISFVAHSENFSKIQQRWQFIHGTQMLVSILGKLQTVITFFLHNHKCKVDLTRKRLCQCTIDEVNTCWL